MLRLFVKILEKMRLQKRAVFAFIFAFMVAVAILASFADQTTFAKVALPTPTELRGVWLTNIDSDVMFDRDRLTAALQQLQALNFNTVYPTVWNWGYTLYPSPVAKRIVGRSLDLTPGLQGRDILKELVKQGHQRGIGVIPWFEFGFMAPDGSELAARHPDWLTSRLDGTQIWQEGPHSRVWLNPLQPEVQQFIQDLVIEIVTNYDIDGIQFDDHFGFPVEFGYDAFTVALYQQEHAGQSPPHNPKDPTWVRWRADKVTKFMTQVFRAVKARKPKCLIALAPNPQEFSYSYSLADWQTWEQQGLLEELIVQVYRDDLNNFIAELVRPEVQTALRHIPVGVGILTGVKTHPVEITQIENQVQAARKQGLAGVSFFYYETLWNNTPQTAAERQSSFRWLFPTPVKRPNLLDGWQPSETLARPKLSQASGNRTSQL